MVCDIADRNASQSHHMNSLIDIHTTHILSQSHSQKNVTCERAIIVSSTVLVQTEAGPGVFNII